MKKTVTTFRFVSFSAAIVATTLTSCSNGQFIGAGKNNQAVRPAATNKPSSNQIPSTPVPTASQPVITPIPTIVPPRNTPIVEPTPIPVIPTPMPVLPTPTPLPPQPTVQPQQSPDVSAGEGTLTFAVAAIANMESGYQATNPGFRAILKDSSGRLVAAGPMTIDAVMNGQTVDAQTSSGFPAFALNVKLLYVSSTIPKSGNGTLFVCMAADPMAALDQSSCKHLNGGAFGDGTNGASEGDQLYRPFQWDQGKAVTYNVDAQNKITIDGYGKSMGLTGGSLPNLSIMNAMFTPATGEKVGRIDARSPLVLDLTRKGSFDLTSAWDEKNPVSFDLMNNGKKDRIGWIGKNAGLLVLDVNGKNGIENGSELFGEYSARVNESQKKGLADANFNDGFSALAQYDANFDGVVDAKDPVFKKLMIWTDKNHDGVSQPLELKSLASMNIKAIDLDFTKVGTVDKKKLIHGNEIRLLGHYVMNDGKRYEIADVWFNQRTATAKLEDVFPMSRKVATKGH